MAEIEVPVSFLLNTELIASVKLMWMLNRLDPGSLTPDQLQTLSGLSRPTVLKRIAQLDSAGWHRSLPHTPFVRVPRTLLTDRRLSAQARVLRSILEVTPGFTDGTGSTTYLQLANLAGRGLQTVKQAMQDLAQLDWISIRQSHQLAPIQFTCRDPFAGRAMAEVEEARRRLEESRYMGEAIMREFLTILVDSAEFEDDAAPGFLVNPLTDERMQFDRFYPPDVAFEFNGPQHYQPTDLFPVTWKVAQQRARDYMKAGICFYRRVQLVIVHAEDLHLEGLREKTSPILPMRDLSDHGPLIDFLETASRHYRQAVQRRGLKPGQPDPGSTNNLPKQTSRNGVPPTVDRER